MRILFSAQNFKNEVAGAELCAQTLLKNLAKKHDVEVVSRGENGDYEWEGIKVHEVKCPNNILYINLFWSRYLDRLKTKPDLVITQLNAAAPTEFWAKKKGIPCIFYVHSFEHFCLESFKFGDVFGCGQRCSQCTGARTKILSPLYSLIYSRNKKALREADVVISPSRFMQEVVRHYSGVDSYVVPNPMELEGYRAGRKGDTILFVKALKHKGVDLVGKLVKRLPNRKFTIVGDLDPDYAWLAKEENVEYMGRIADMREAYAKARIVLIPSNMAESFSRVTVEAMINGLPVITSDKGGPAETSGAAGINIPTDDVQGWADAIEKLYKDEGYYREKCRASLKESKRYDLEKSLEIFHDLVKRKTGLKLL